MGSSNFGTTTKSGREPASATLKETLLVVDDSASICELVRQTLTPIGYQVIVAVSGESAIRLAEQHAGEIHLLLTDLTLPKMGGQQIAEKVVIVRPGIKVVFMSGHHEEDDRVVAATRSGAAFLQKPFSIRTLRNRVREILDVTPNPSA